MGFLSSAILARSLFSRKTRKGSSQLDILSVPGGVIVHSANAKGVMGAGLALAIRERWPRVYTLYRSAVERGAMRLGDCMVMQVGPSLWVATLIGQEDYGREPGTVYTDYAAVRSGLKLLATALAGMKIQDQPVYFPFRMGCGLGGGNWDIVHQLILDQFPQAMICRKDGY